jgi:cytoskeletal protein CcmA (bactofilin family)
MWKRRQSPKPLTVLSINSEIQGDLFVEGDLCVAGIIHGRVEVRGNMEILPTGLVEGPEIRAQSLRVQGVAKAQVTLEGPLVVTQGARLEGNVVATAIEVQPGGSYGGHALTQGEEMIPKGLPSAAVTQEFVPSVFPGTIATDNGKPPQEIILGDPKGLR